MNNHTAKLIGRAAAALHLPKAMLMARWQGLTHLERVAARRVLVKLVEGERGSGAEQGQGGGDPPERVPSRVLDAYDGRVHATASPK